jgi:omega-6 fatty acid desaturase (delta-12 desaturase)
MALSARDLMQVMARYREPSRARSLFELAVTGAPFVLLWVAAWLALAVSYWLTLGISILAAGFLVRLFMIQHDCGHGAFFGRKALDDWLGRVLGVLTLTPYDVWRRSHSIHHATSGNLARRGIGDIDTLTVAEYVSMPTWRRWLYRLYRNPFVMFGLGPAYLFLFQNRLPLGFMRGGVRYWLSAMATNLAILAAAGAMIHLVGAGTFLMVHIPITLLAASIGVWLFYVQHQFEHTFWAGEKTWTLHEAALYGSSYYDLPQPLRWLTANIGMHHVHHLYSRIPFYRLPQVLRDFPELGRIRRLTLWQSLACVRLSLWDEGRRRLVSFREAREAARLG